MTYSNSNDSSLSQVTVQLDHTTDAKTAFATSSETRMAGIGYGAIDFGTHRYKAQLDKLSPASTELGKLKRCMLGISLGTHNIEGARLEAVLEWISANFEQCAIVVGDSVYRLTLALLEGLEPEPALVKALQHGREFERCYAPLFRQYSHKCRFEWLPLSKISNAPQFPAHLATLEQLYARNGEFQQSVQRFAQAYLGRGDKIAETCTTHLSMTKQYLLEEAAMFACLREQDWPILVYPGSIDSIVELCEGRFGVAEQGAPDASLGAPEPLSRLAFVALDVKKKGLFFSDGRTKVIRAGATADPSQHQTQQPQEFLENLADGDWASFLKATKLRKFAPREILVRAEQSDRQLYLLLDGRAEVSVIRSDGTVQQLAILEPGTVFGEQAFLDGLPRAATVTAMSECNVRVLSRKDFQALAERAPSIALAVMEDLGRVLSLRARQMQFEMRHML